LAVDLVLLRPAVLTRASEPMPLPVGTLDAIHLATALVWRDRVGPLPQMLTHGAVLGAAARAFGFDGGIEVHLAASSSPERSYGGQPLASLAASVGKPRHARASSKGCPPARQSRRWTNPTLSGRRSGRAC
jgi:hypothetical protein